MASRRQVRVKENAKYKFNDVSMGGTTWSVWYDTTRYGLRPTKDNKIPAKMLDHKELRCEDTSFLKEHDLMHFKKIFVSQDSMKKFFEDV